MADLEQIQSKLRALSSNYAAELPAKLTDIESLWKHLLVSYNDKDLSDLISLCHKLAGSGASFGFKKVSANARAAEIELGAVLGKNKLNKTIHWDDSTRSRLTPIIEKLLDEKDSQPLEEFNTSNKVKQKNSISPDEEKTLIYIQEKNRLIVDELISKLENYNYSVRNFSSLNELQQAILNQAPDVIVIDSTLFNAPTKKILMELKSEHQFKIIHLASSGDFNDRLEAVRTGVDYYFTKPIDFSAVIDTLDILSDKIEIFSPKVLIVDDSISTSEFYSLSLEEVDIETKIVTDPFKVMNELIDFKPDLILLDLNMPKCNGLELASVIRQQENFISTPIVFLSGETDTQKQLKTLETGADEFLTKPINVNHLIAVVKNKIIRYRQLSAYMHNDSLTGLLNHTSILSVLDTEVERTKREKTNLSYAMVDIDLFKKINDTYGHHMGDTVIKNISRFIKKNLRVTDSVGRYGGEEFAVILPGIDKSTAEIVMQKILDAFSQIEFTHLNHKFNVSFSCGIADYHSFNSAEEMVEAADKALYVAKDSGRHCIRTASPN